jgi:hypothetical protein
MGLREIGRWRARCRVRAPPFGAAGLDGGARRMRKRNRRVLVCRSGTTKRSNSRRMRAPNRGSSTDLAGACASSIRPTPMLVQCARGNSSISCGSIRRRVVTLPSRNVVPGLLANLVTGRIAHRSHGVSADGSQMREALERTGYRASLAPEYIDGNAPALQQPVAEPASNPSYFEFGRRGDRHYVFDGRLIGLSGVLASLPAGGCCACLSGRCACWAVSAAACWRHSGNARSGGRRSARGLSLSTLKRSALRA